MNVAFIGVGQMGLPMVRQAVAAGHDVTFRVRTTETAAMLAGERVHPAESFADRDLVIVCVYDGNEVREVGEMALSTMRAGATLINHTTCSPAALVSLAESARQRGIGLLDAALSGGPAEIAAGSLTLLVGGEVDLLDASRPMLASYSDPIIHVGQVGDGQKIKLINNALFGAQVALAVEAERVAGDLGVDPGIALSSITRCSGDSRALQSAIGAGSAQALRDIAGRFIAKDLATVEAVARELDVHLGRLGDEPYRAADLEAIKQLKARYFRYIDTKQWEAFADLFTVDCVHHLPEDSDIPTMSNEEYLPSVQAQLDNGVTIHQGHMPEITLLSDTEAEGVWQLNDYVQVEGINGRISIMGWGFYYEKYRKCDDGQWRISAKRNTRLRVDQMPWKLPWEVS